MESKFIPKEIELEQKELVSDWAMKKFGIQGDSIVSGVGYYKKEKVLYFVVENSDTDIERTLLKQWLLLYTIKDKLNHRLKGDVIQRLGENLFAGETKLSSSFVVKSKTSNLTYIGINMGSENMKGLRTYGIDHIEIAEAVMNEYRAELKTIEIKKGKM